MSNAKNTCFVMSGSLTKAGQPCGFLVPHGQKTCHHHDPDPDKTRQKRILTKAGLASAEASAPKITTNDFKTLDDCLAVRSAVVAELCSKARPNYRALEMILKAASGASADHATKTMEKQNEILLALGGHGAGIAMLQRLREAPLRVLPGKRKVLDLAEVLEAKPADTQPVPSTTPEQEA